MRYSWLSIASIIILFTSTSWAQECGTSITDQDLSVIQDLRRKISNGDYSSRDLGDGLIPVAFHIISEDDSTNGMDTTALYAEMDIVQQRFAPAGMEFYQCGEINYYYDSDYVNFEKYVSEDICDANDIPDVLNIWFADNVFKMDEGEVVSICGYAYLSGSNDRVIIDNDCGDNSSTLAHEIGHYFSLLHTHSTSGVGAELVNGTNCLVAGDLLCDTPADPRLSSSNVSSTCDYVGTETDALGATYSPDPENIMSYSRKYCRVEFSQDQLDQMVAYVVDYRNYLQCSSVTGTTIQLESSFLAVYPNPFSDYLDVQFKVTNPNSTRRVELFDVYGRKVLDRSYSDSSVGMISKRINELGFLPSGSYFLKITLDSEVDTRVIVRL